MFKKILRILILCILIISLSGISTIATTPIHPNQNHHALMGNIDVFIRGGLTGFTILIHNKDFDAFTNLDCITFSIAGAIPPTNEKYKFLMFLPETVEPQTWVRLTTNQGQFMFGFDIIYPTINLYFDDDDNPDGHISGIGLLLGPKVIFLPKQII